MQNKPILYPSKGGERVHLVTLMLWYNTPCGYENHRIKDQAFQVKNYFQF